MLFQSFALMLSAASSVLALGIVEPELEAKFTAGGKFTVKWNHVATDVPQAALALTNNVIWPPVFKILVNAVVINTDEITLNLPSDVTSNDYYRVAFVNASNTPQIYAESDNFSVLNDKSDKKAEKSDDEKTSDKDVKKSDVPEPAPTKPADHKSHDKSDDKHKSATNSSGSASKNSSQPTNPPNPSNGANSRFSFNNAAYILSAVAVVASLL